MLDNPTYVNENTQIGGLQYKDNKEMKWGKTYQMEKQSQ